MAEFLLITLSILMAFALDAWWDGLAARRKLDSQLLAVRDELQVAQSELVRAIEVQSGVRTQQTLWLNLMTPSPSDADVAAFFMIPSADLGRAGNPLRITTLDLPVGALQSLLAQDLWSAIRDEDLRVRLANWRSMIDDARGTDFVLNEWITGLHEVAAADAFLPLMPSPPGVDPLEDRFPSDIPRLLSDPEIANRLLFTIRLGGAAIREKEELHQVAEDLLESINRFVTR